MRPSVASTASFCFALSLGFADKALELLFDVKEGQLSSFELRADIDLHALGEVELAEGLADKAFESVPIVGLAIPLADRETEASRSVGKAVV